jgi:peptidoglycan/LPS O-acetylase OafA/YrhL
MTGGLPVGSGVARTIDADFDAKHNSLNFLRLVFATAVIVSHTWPLGGYGPDPRIAGESLGTWAVAGFFAISGYLIANSRLHTSPLGFLGRRVLRIYPAYIVCLLVTVLAFAPLSVVLGSGSVSWSSAASYFIKNLFLKLEQNDILHTLGRAPYGAAWNGSTWTLFYEFACYLMIGILLSFAVRWHRAIVVTAFALALVLAIAAHHRGAGGTVGDFAFLAPFFLAGSVLAIYARHIPFDWRLGVLGLVLLPISTEIGAMSSLGALPAAYVCLWLGGVLPFQAVGRKNDISYGIYIYAFPVQQLLVVLHSNRLPVGVMVILSIVCTVPFAVASWFLVEKPALAQKNRFGGARRRQRAAARPSVSQANVS